MIEKVYFMALLFAVYSILGWCTEVIYHTVTTGNYVNRGFLSGPVCPIYGFGIGLVLFLLAPFEYNVIMIFIGSLILTTVIEYITGLVLEKLFNRKWWDYSSEPFNIRGYICLKFSLIWGIACVIIVVIIQPALSNLLTWMPVTIGLTFLFIFYSIFIVDSIITIMTMLNIKKRIKIVNLIQEFLEQESELIGENLSDGVVILMRAKEKTSEELSEIREKYEKIFNARVKGVERITKAFPKSDLFKNREILEKFKIHIKKN